MERVTWTTRPDRLRKKEKKKKKTWEVRPTNFSCFDKERRFSSVLGIFGLHKKRRWEWVRATNKEGEGFAYLDGEGFSTIIRIKAVSSGGTKTKLEERKSVGGGKGKFGMEAKGAESFSLLG
nr:hypothetical protein CFP56_08914 [Quercus suber]